MSTVTVSPLRLRMIEDMNARKLCAGTQRGHIHTRGTTTRATCARRTGTTTTRRTATTTLVFAVPELTSGSENPHLNRPISMVLPAVVGIRRNAQKVGVLVATVDAAAKARRPRGCVVRWSHYEYIAD
jgi:hypothetical protein